MVRPVSLNGGTQMV